MTIRKNFLVYAWNHRNYGDELDNVVTRTRDLRAAQRYINDHFAEYDNWQVVDRRSWKSVDALISQPDWSDTIERRLMRELMAPKPRRGV